MSGMLDKYYKKYSDTIGRRKLYCGLMLSLLFIVTLAVGIQSLKRGFIADDFLLRTNISNFGWDMLEKEVISKYTGDINFDLKNHIIGIHISPRPVTNSWIQFIRWVLTPQGDASLYRLVIILQYFLASFCAYIFFRDMFGEVYPALLAVSIFHFSTWRDHNFHFVSLGFNSGLAQLFFCIGIMAFKKFLLLYSKPEPPHDTTLRIRLVFWYIFSLSIGILGSFSYDSYGPAFLGSVFLLLIFEDAIYYGKPLLSVKKMLWSAIIILPFFAILIVYLLYRQQINAEFLLKYKYLATIIDANSFFTLPQFIAGYIYGILYYIPIPPYIITKTVLLHFQIIIPLLFIAALSMAIWIFVRLRNKNIFNERKELYLFVLFILLVILNIFPIALDFSPRIAIGVPIVFAMFLTVMMRNVKFGNLFLAIYISLSAFSFMQISSNWGKIDTVRKNVLSEIGRKIQNHQNYVSFVNIEHIGTYALFTMQAVAFEQIIYDSQGKEIHTKVPFFYYFYSFEDFKKSKITIEPLKKNANNSTFLIKIDGCICGIKIGNLKSGADEIDYAFGHLNVIEWQPKLNKYQKVSLAKEVLFELKPGFEPLIIPMERLKVGI